MNLREELEDLVDRAWVARMGKEIEALAKASTLSDAEADAALEKARQEVAKPASVTSLADARAKAADAKAKQRQRPAWFVPLAAAAAVLLLAGATYWWTPVGRQIDAWLSPAPTENPTPLLPVPPTHEETPQEKAAKLRDMALVDVKKGYIGDATDEMNAADEIRQAIHDAKPRVENFVKAPIGPTERPLVPLKKWHLK